VIVESEMRSMLWELMSMGVFGEVRGWFIKFKIGAYAK
jgi:hypothetical protein